MRLFSVFLYFLCCATKGKAADTAGIFETLFHYYAYRIELSAFPDQGDRMIAWGCVPATGTVCTFYEFVQAVRDPGTTAINIDAANTILPPVEDADMTFADMRFVGTYELASLYRDASRLNHVKLLATITNRVQEAQNLVKTQASFHERYPGVTLYETEEKLDSVIIKVIDWVKTAEVQASRSNSKATALQTRYKKWGSTTPGSEYRHHQNILRAFAINRNVLNAVPSCRA
ncbi:uncharacterized protein BP01DRAFT_384431 [Aspergillus saccharolyticus JOP 1030-1]|uniref:Uncharacterized protein n=1 Tax=Aspergillus saccharolyticus JOP 1030-1 TaxID=1450539 RepID=A0A318ZTT2_9EURO|nr:hypothetical protein BP01DRAFT_384431 [Aspergillus saccharolyticus JOP 1030-1]PYH43498.1 hypothetical protein BP01DRAFT_384431 [Aspergillus saccharolyticus JOP 1030-1]